jgi:hypothetical protein
MLTVEDLKNKVINFPDDKPVEDLFEEIMVLYKIQKGLDNINYGDIMSLDDFDKETDKWL